MVLQLWHLLVLILWSMISWAGVAFLYQCWRDYRESKLEKEALDLLPILHQELKNRLSRMSDYQDSPAADMMALHNSVLKDYIKDKKQRRAIYKLMKDNIFSHLFI